jgi:hypothetical protein
MQKVTKALQDAQDLTEFSPQEFSRRLDDIYASKGADAAQALLSEYTKALEGVSGDNSMVDQDAEIEKMLAEIGDYRAAQSSVPSPVIGGEMAAAINAEIAATTSAKPSRVAAAEPITVASDDEVARAVEAVENRDNAHGTGQLDIKLAPGCFGGPLLFRAGAKECVACPFMERCGPIATERLIALRKNLKDSRAVIEKKTLRLAPADPDAIEPGYETPEKAKERAQARERQRRKRVRDAVPSFPAPAPVPTPAAASSPEADRAREWHKQLIAWTAGTGPRQRKLRGREIEFVKVRVLRERLATELGREPTPGELAKRLDADRDVVRRRLAVLEQLEQPEGPWHPRGVTTGELDTSKA